MLRSTSKRRFEAAEWAAEEMAQVGDELGCGRFEVRDLLGEGAMGRVYRAFDRKLQQDVALKSLARIGPDERYDIKREFRALAGFSHPNVVQLYELFAEGEEWFFSMQLVEGEPLLEYVRDGAPAGSMPSPPQLAAALRALAQVGEGLAALHAAGQLHRDVKPANVRVEPQGRAVLLDFGLATLERRGFEADRPGFAGTLAYAAPEQVFGAAEPASDWYALGASLFELLTGEPPRERMRPSTEARFGPAPRQRVSGVPPRLDSLVAALLAPEPAFRPKGEFVVDELLALAGAQGQPRSVAPRPPFVGRREARERLTDALERSRTRAAVIWVSGPSGIGKSELVMKFVGDCRTGGATVLSGRCRPQESVPFRSLDPLVDGLSRHWVELEPEAALRLVPEHASALTRVFPVLARVPVLAGIPAGPPVSDDELLRRATGALRDVLSAIAAENPLVLWIDDAQWGDRGSVPLLRSLLRGPHAPRLLLVLSHRSSGNERTDTLDLLREAFVAEDVANETLELPPLTDAEAQELLLCALSGTAVLTRGEREAMIAGAGGSPFLLLELARHLDAEGGRAVPAPRVVDLLARRLAPLEEPSRRVLELSAVASRPLAASFLLDLAGIGPGGQPLVLGLCAQSLLRSGAGEADGTLEPYHDRIREAVLAGLAPNRLRQRHRAIAEALDADDTDPGLLVEHWMGAGEDARAAGHAVRAGERAVESLAFDRAADYFGLALRLRGARDGDWELRARRAEALANAGRGADAGEAFDDSAAAFVSAPQNATRAAQLRARAAEQYLYAGRWEDGLARTREVMAHLGIVMPATAAEAMRRANLKRAGFLLGRRPTERDGTGVADAPTRERLAMLFGCAKGTALLFPKLSDYLGMIYLREAIRARDAEHVAIGLAKEASLEAALPGRWWRARAQRLLATARAVADRSGLPHAIGTVLTCESACAYFSADWAGCVASGERALDVFRNRCVGNSESLSITITFLLPGLVQCGELRRLGELLPGFIDDAQRRGDLTLVRALQAGDASLATLAAGDPDAVTASADRLRTLPTSPEEASLHYHYALATWRASLYRGDVADALRRLDEAWEPLRASGMLSFEVFSVRLRANRAATALAAAARGGVPGSSPSALVRLASKEARRVARSKLPLAAPWAAVLRAGLATLRGDDAERSAELARARAGFGVARMPLHEHACAILDGNCDAAARTRGAAFLSEQGVKEPTRLAAALLPGVAAP